MLPRRVTCKRDLEGHDRNSHAAVLGRTGHCDDPQPVFARLPEGPTKAEFDVNVEKNITAILAALGELEAHTVARFFERASGVFCTDCGRPAEALPGDHTCSVVHLVCASEDGYEALVWNVAAYHTVGADVMAATHAARANARAIELRDWQCIRGEGWGMHPPSNPDLCGCGETRPTNEYDPPYGDDDLRRYANTSYHVTTVSLRKGILAA